MIYRFSVFAFAFLFLVGCSDPISVDSEAPTAESRRFTPPNPATKNLTIAEIVVATVNDSGEFSTLLAALDRADLVGAVSGRSIFTVFAPTNDAFAKLGLNAHNIDTVPVEDLTQILLYHVVQGRRVASIVLGSSSLTTLQGGSLTVDASNAALIDANDRSAGIVAVDIAARNGIVHVIDTVVLP